MMVRAICLWPGLPAIWLRGLARELFMSLIFSWFICGLLLATFVWPEWVSLGILRLLWLLAVGAWAASTLRNCWTLPKLLAIGDQHSAQALVDAQLEYLRGNWFEAEAKLLQILHEHPRDAEALLLLVGILRRTRRFPPALRRVAQLERLDTASGWQFEINREKRIIERDIAEHNSTQAGRSGAPTEDIPIEDADGNAESPTALPRPTSEAGTSEAGTPEAGTQPVMETAVELRQPAEALG